MAWFRNFYHCDDCNTSWWDEWSSDCDDDCPECGSRNWSPWWSEDLSMIIEERDSRLVILHSPNCATDKPRYVQVVEGTPSAAFVPSWCVHGS
jgi:hypothetical protein